MNAATLAEVKEALLNYQIEVERLNAAYGQALDVIGKLEGINK